MNQIVAFGQERFVADLVLDRDVGHVPLVAKAEHTWAIDTLMFARPEDDAILKWSFDLVVDSLHFWAGYSTFGQLRRCSVRRVSRNRLRQMRQSRPNDQDELATGSLATTI